VAVTTYQHSEKETTTFSESEDSMTTASIFTGVMLTNESRKALLWYGKEALGGLLQQHKADHMTIKFRGSPNKIPPKLMGRMVELRVLSLIEAEGIQAAEVMPLGPAADLECANEYPHVTISVDKGVAPKHSNKVLKDCRDSLQKCKATLVLKGQVGFVHDRYGWVFSHLPDEEMVPTPWNR
jgi:hypothetical protein